MRIPMITLFAASTMFAGAALAQTQEVIDNRPASSEADAVMDSAPTPTDTADERIREYSKEDNEQVVTEAQPGAIDGVPEGSAPLRPNLAGENAVIDEKPGNS